MEAKWVLTGEQKKIRFRNLIRKRKMKTAKMRRVLKKASSMPHTINKKELTISLQRQLKILVPQQDRNIAGGTDSSPHSIPTSTKTLADSVSYFKPEELTERQTLPLSTSNSLECFPLQLDFRAKLLQLQQFATKSGKQQQHKNKNRAW